MTTRNRNRNRNRTAPAAPEQQTPEQAPAPAAPAAPAAPEQAPAPAAPEQTDETLAAKMEADAAKAESEVHFKAGVNAVVRGIEGQRSASLEAGKEFWTCLKLAFKGGLSARSRTSRMEDMEAEIRSKTREKVKVDNLIRAYAAFSCFAEADRPELGTSHPYWLWRDVLSKLTEPQNWATKDESFILLPGFENECRATFASILECKDGLEGATAKADALLVDYHKALAARKDQEAKERAARVAELGNEAAALKAKREQAERDAAEAEAEAAALANKIKETSDAAAAAALQAQLAAQQGAHAEAERVRKEAEKLELEKQKQRDKERAAADTARKAAGRAEEKAGKLEEKLSGDGSGSGSPRNDDGTIAISPKTYKDTSAKDLASMLFALLIGNKNSAPAFLRLCELVAAAKGADPKMRDRAMAALNVGTQQQAS